eukprot:COSAG05_NODE_3495_length_2026_cov_620.642968_3_plen_152_part_00
MLPPPPCYSRRRTTAPGETTFSKGSRGYGCRIWWHRHHLLCIPYMPPFVSSSALGHSPASGPVAPGRTRVGARLPSCGAAVDAPPPPAHGSFKRRAPRALGGGEGRCVSAAPHLATNAAAAHRQNGGITTPQPSMTSLMTRTAPPAVAAAY